MTDNNSAPELLPCPFCGGEAELVDDRLCWFVRCNACKPFSTVIYGERASEEDANKSDFHWYNIRKSAVDAWNRRADLCAADRGVTVGAGSITGDRSEIDRLVKLLRTGKFGADVMHRAADLIEALAESEFNAHIAALQPTEAGSPAYERGYLRGYAHGKREATPPTDNTALVEALTHSRDRNQASRRWHMAKRKAAEKDRDQYKQLYEAALASREAPPAVTVDD